jgi:hypothetical protein
MPRSTRIDIPNILQHVIVRGIEKRDIFLDDSDRAAFVQRFSALLQETGTQCLGWAFPGRQSPQCHQLSRLPENGLHWGDRGKGIENIPIGGMPTRVFRRAFGSKRQAFSGYLRRISQQVTTVPLDGRAGSHFWRIRTWAMWEEMIPAPVAAGKNTRSAASAKVNRRPRLSVT